MRQKNEKNRNQIYGLHSVKALLLNHPEQVIQLFLQQGRHDERLQEIMKLAKRHKLPLQLIERATMDTWVAEPHQGVIAECTKAPEWTENDLIECIQNTQTPPLLLVLDGVQDPHNLGACLRTADAAGVHAVIIPKDRASSLTAAVRKVASGAAETIPVIAVTNIARTLDVLKEQGVWLIGACGEADRTLYEMDFKIATALVLGSEGEGLRHLTREKCDFLAKIPMHGYVTSLNVSVATGVFLFEAVRQRKG